MSIVKKARATNPRMEWLPLGAPEFGTMAEAKKHLHHMEASKWKWARPPGDGKTQARFCCTSHEDCERLLRVKLDGFMYILEGLGEHSLVPTLKKRSNSTLTLDMERRVRESMDQGGTSSGLCVALTNTKAAEIRAEGMDPVDFKREGGGLIGALCTHQQSRIRHDTVEYNVFSLYRDVS